MSAFAKVGQIKIKLARLHARDIEASEMIERGQRLKAEVAVEIEATEAELASAVAAPAEGNVDPTDWLPNELMIMILLLQLYGLDGCRRVCKRWHTLCRDRQMKSVVGLSRWRAVADGTASPRRRIEHGGYVSALAVGTHGKVYTGAGFSVKVWCGWTGDYHQTLNGHAGEVNALAIGHDGRVHSGSLDRTVKVWSGDDGALIRTLTGHAKSVSSLAVNKIHVYSGSCDCTVRVWLCSTGECVHALAGHTLVVKSLALDNRAKLLYSGSHDGTIRVWSLSDHTYIRTLLEHKGSVVSLAVGQDGTLFSGSFGIIRVWSGKGGLLHTLQHLDSGWVNSLAIVDGTLLSSDHYGTRVWHREQGWKSQDVKTALVNRGPLPRKGLLAVGKNGRVCSSSYTVVLLWN